MTIMVPSFKAVFPSPTEDGFYHLTSGVHRGRPSVARSGFVALAEPTKAPRATTATPHSRGFFNAESPSKTLADTMTPEQIRAAESLGMDGVVGVRPSERMHGKPQRPCYPSDISPEERAAMMNGLAYRTQCFQKDSMLVCD